MSTEKFDVVILGGGNAGLGVTGPVRRAGMSVAMVEQDLLGGTCPNRGCTPKKVLVAAGHALHEIERAAVHHIAVGKPRLDWAALIDREKDMIKDLPANLGRSMVKRNVEVIRGSGVFGGPNLIRVGSRELEARHIVIATGSKPRPLPIPGAEHMIASDEMLSERDLPASVIFVGGGVISLEFGHVYARAGANVTILEALPQLLPALDADAVARLQTENERIGISVRTAISVKRIEPADGRLRVVFTHGGEERSIEANRVVNGAGRVANLMRWTSPPGISNTPTGALRSTIICARPRTRSSMSAAMRCRPRRNCRRSRPMRATWSAATSSKGRPTAPTTPAWQRRSIPCRRSQPSD